RLRRRGGADARDLRRRRRLHPADPVPRAGAAVRGSVPDAGAAGHGPLAAPGGARPHGAADPRAPAVASVTPAGRRPADVVIGGAGIGGVAAALALHRHGVGCRVLEASRELRPLGVGINLLPSAARVMADLGLLERLLDGAVETGELLYVNRFGQRI